MATLDLKEDYLHIPIYESHRKFLRITVYLDGSVSHLQFTPLPFGISSAPYIFTNVVSAVVAVLRLQGI